MRRTAATLALLCALAGCRDVTPADVAEAERVCVDRSGWDSVAADGDVTVVTCKDGTLIRVWKPR
jgi:ribonuclease PH